MTENKNISTNLPKINFNSEKIVALVSTFLNNREEGICLICSDLKVCWSQFKSQFIIHEAAGGKVLNAAKDVLFIYRFNKWDLPKGKLEKGESIENCAIREVKEECGVSDLIIEKPLETTYHIFERKEQFIFKITYWFQMKTNFSEQLTPQIEEGITQVIFKNKQATIEALKNTYGNIKLLF